MKKATPDKFHYSNSITNKYNINYNGSSSKQPVVFNSNTSTNYFCHYKNAMYMGGIKSFKKDGKGLLLHDCGLSVLTNYSNDVMHGHNVFFADHCLLSAQFVKGRVNQAVYRTDGFLAHLFYNVDNQLEGKCKLFSFIDKNITYAIFKKGILVEKMEENDFSTINKIFDLGEMDFLIGQVHANVMKYDFKKINNIQGNKYGNKLVIGFQKGGLINGLAFTIIFRGSHGGYNPETHRNEDVFQLRITQRGYMYNSQLHGFGQKSFKNENYYIGEFKNGIFEGNGLLRNTAKKNWVSGYFEKGNLIDLHEYNNEGGDKKFDKVIQGLHERKTNWINNQILLISMDAFDKQIEKILNQTPDLGAKSLEQRKQQVLKRIQDNFLCQPNGIPSFDASPADKWKKTNKIIKIQQSVKHFVNSFIPQKHDNQYDSKDQQILKKQIQEQEGYYKLSSTVRLPNSIRKSKIFQKSLTPLKYYLNTDRNRSQSKRYNSKTPLKKKIFNLSPSTKSKLVPVQSNSDFKNISQGLKSQNTNKKDVFDNSNRENSVDGSHAGHHSSQNNNNFENGKVNTTGGGGFSNTLNPSRFTGGKTMIFKAKKKDNQISPKFIYTNIENPKEVKMIQGGENL